MKIAHLDSHIAWRGGEQQVLYLSQFLYAQGYHSVVVCPRHSALYQRAMEARLPVKALRMRHELDVVAACQLAYYLRCQQVDILHMHGAHAHTIGLLAGVLVPRVQKVVSRRVDFPPIRNLFSRWKYCSPAVHYLTVSEAVRQVLMAGGIPASRVQTVHSGIDLGRFDHIASAPALFPPGTRVVGTAGHLAGHKGQRYLIEAIRYLRQAEPNIGVVIAGDGELRPVLEAQAAALGVGDCLRFTGFRRDILALMQQWEVFIQASYLEGLGTAVLDAMALRKPVVATRVGGILEVVQDGQTGYLVPPRDPQALATAVIRLLQDEALRRTFGEAGRRRVAACFTAERMAAHTLQTYQQLQSASGAL